MKSYSILSAARKTLVAATAALVVGTSAVSFAAAQPQSYANGPASVADLAEGLLGAVVNISTSQIVKGSEGPGAVPMPQLPEGSPFQDFFNDFFKDKGGNKGGSQKVQSLGSGFVIDATGNWYLPFLMSMGLLLLGGFSAFLMHPERPFEEASELATTGKVVAAE